MDQTTKTNRISEFLDDPDAVEAAMMSTAFVEEELTPEEQEQVDALEDPDKPVVSEPTLPLEPDAQRQLLALLINVPEFATKHLPALKPEYFVDDAHRKIAKIICDHFQEFGAIPGKIVLRSELAKAVEKMKVESKPRYFSEMEMVCEFLPLESSDWYTKQLTSFVKTSKLKTAIREALEIIKAGKVDLPKLISTLQDAEAAGDNRERSFEDANAILSLPDPDWLVQGVLAEGAFGLIWGLPGSYKTFLGLDMALSMAHGLPFLNQFAVPGEIPVAYISPEGTAGLKYRLNAWMMNRDVQTLKNITICRHAFQLNEPGEVELVIKQLMHRPVKPKVLFVDTLARNFAGDENSTKDMSAFVNNLMAISSRLQVAIVVVHHSGKDSAKGARGSIALTGAVDTSISVTKEEGATQAVVKCVKQKDAEPFRAFTVEGVPTGPSIVLAYQGQAAEKVSGDEPQRYSDVLPCVLPLRSDPMTRMALVERTNLSKTVVYRLMALAQKYGFVVPLDTKPVKYELTDEGVKFVDDAGMAEK